MKIVFKIIFVTIMIGLGLKIFVIERFVVPTDSMTPTIAVGQRVWLCKLPFKLQKNDIIGFERNGENFVKRIVGMPSDAVFREAERFHVYQNQERLLDNQRPVFKIPQRGETIVIYPTNYTFYQSLIQKEGAQVTNLFGKIFINGYETKYYTFKQNYYFVQGDNTDNSIDSRQFGLIGEGSVLGWLL